MRHFSHIAALLAALISAPVLAEETRIGEAGFVSPPATLSELDWLIGQWSGEGIEGAPAMESWLPPSGGTMVGTFVQQSSDGTILFSEHMYLIEEEGSLSLKLKHFNADLTGWEEKGDMLTFRLVAIEPCAAYFNALTLRCADPHNPSAGLVAAVRMQSDKSEPQELVFTFNRLGREKSRPCPGAETTLQMNECYASHYAAAQERHQSYLDAARKHESKRPELIAMIDQSEKAFEEYRTAECDAVYENWKSGTIRNMMTLACAIDLTNQRTHTVWSTWLTYMDSSEPVLPEPKPAMEQFR